jgi:uracil-DNA glycosylase
MQKILDFDFLKVVMINDKPTCIDNSSNGLAFSSRSYKLNYDEMVFLDLTNKIHQSYIKLKDRGFEYLANRGVLLYNSSLTTTVSNKISSHYHIWKPFTEYVIEMLNSYKEKLIILVIDSEDSEKIKNSISSKHIVLSHFKFKEYHIKRKDLNQVFIYDNIFDIINEKLKDIDKEPIDWAVGDYKTKEELFKELSDNDIKKKYGNKY